MKYMIYTIFTSEEIKSQNSPIEEDFTISKFICKGLNKEYCLRLNEAYFSSDFESQKVKIINRLIKFLTDEKNVIGKLKTE